MSDVKWTQEQLDAIETRNCSLLVAAGAGSGKTAVLVERIIRIITDADNPTDIDKLLIVTFTNAAAAEIRERIASAISKKIEDEPYSNRLQRQLTLLSKASIGTLHSFCLNVIKNNFHCINIDPNFRISDDTENILLKQEAVDELFEEKYEEENNAEFLRLVEYYSNNKDDSNLKNIVLNLYNFSSSFPWQENWLKEVSHKFKEKDFDKLIRLYLSFVKDKILAFKQMYDEALYIIDNEVSLEPYNDNFQNEISFIEDLINSVDDDYDKFTAILNSFEFTSLKRCKKGVDKEKQEKVKSIRDNIKKQIKTIKDDMANINRENFEKENDAMVPIIGELVKLVIEFKNKFSNKKKERGIIDFNDIEHFCLDILCSKTIDDKIKPSETAYEIRKKYDEILIDEYQDTNLIQETILSLIKNEEPNVFMVGDIKQSIYRFRQASPELFLSKYNTYSSLNNSKNRKILLYKNFRSRKEIISVVNFIFKNIMTEKIGELNYTDKEALNYGADYKDVEDSYTNSNRAAEVHILDKKAQNDENIEEDVTNVQMEARIAALRIKELVQNEFKVYDRKQNQYRSVEYKDIVILLRSTLNYAPVFMEELKNNDIPVYADTGTGYFDTVEIKTMMAVLQIIDNPLQDIPLIAVLRSPIFSFSEDEIIDIRAYKDSTYIYNNLISIEYNNDAAIIDDSVIKKIKNFLKKLNRWREESTIIPLDEFIFYIYTSTGYYGYVGAMPGGVQRQANLRILFQRAKQYQNTSYKGLFNFINFIDKLRQSSGDMGTAKTIGENENVVRIMSIHKSKGLEFPVVILSAAGKKFNMSDLNNKLLFHHDMGIGSDYVDIEKRITHPTIMKQLIKYKIKIESLSEEMRLIYVAFTRAKEKLIITGSVNDIEKSMNRWKDKLNDASCILDWIIPSIIVNEDDKIKDEIIESHEYLDIPEQDFTWKIKVYNRHELSSQNQVNIENNTNTLENFSCNCDMGKYYNKVDKILKYKYPYEISQKLQSVITVTELKRKYNRDMDNDYSTQLCMPYLTEKPSFLNEKNDLTPAQRGTALHSVLEKLSFDKISSSTDIKMQIDTMVMKELITQKEADSINISKITSFFNSDIGKRMLKADKIYREVPFHIEISSREIDKNIQEELYDNEKIILQGIIDCYFEEKDNIVLIDYKTDYVKDVQKIIDRYKIQIEYYAKVLEKIKDKPVREKYLYLFYNNKIVKI